MPLMFLACCFTCVPVWTGDSLNQDEGKLGDVMDVWMKTFEMPLKSNSLKGRDTFIEVGLCEVLVNVQM